MRRITAFGDLLERVASWVVAVALLGLLLIVTLQVVDRHFVTVPIAAPDAYARILLIWSAFIGFALAVKAGLAIRVDLLDHWLPCGVRRLIEICFHLLKLAVLTVLIWKGWALVEIGAYQLILGTDLTTTVPNSGLWVALILIFIFVSIEILNTLTDRAAPLPPHIVNPEARVE